MRTRLILTSSFFLLLSVTYAQPVRSIPAIKIDQPIKIDGNLNDEAWKLVQPTGDFITSQPVFGRHSIQRTEVRIAYDNSAIYIGAYLYEKPENIVGPLRAMVRLGVIKSNNMEVYGLNPYIEFLMIKVFHEKEWI